MDHWIETLIYVHPQQFKYRYEIQTKKNKTKQSKRNKQKKRTTNKTEEIKKRNQIIMALPTVRGVRIIDKSLTE